MGQTVRGRALRLAGTGKPPGPAPSHTAGRWLNHGQAGPSIDDSHETIKSPTPRPTDVRQDYMIGLTRPSQSHRSRNQINCITNAWGGVRTAANRTRLVLPPAGDQRPHTLAASGRQRHTHTRTGLFFSRGGDWAIFARKTFRQCPKKTAMLTCNIALPD